MLTFRRIAITMILVVLATAIAGTALSYCQKLWIGRSGNQGLDGRKEESVSSG